MASNHPLAVRYAKALFELSLESGELLGVESDLIKLDQLIKTDPTIARKLLSPVLNRQSALVLVDKIAEALSFTKIGKNFLLTLVRNRRLSFIGEMINNFFMQIKIYRQEVEIEIISSVDLLDTQLKNIEEVLSEAIKKKILLKVKINKDIIGGLVIIFGSMMLDGSIKNKLERIRSMSLSAVANM